LFSKRSFFKANQAPKYRLGIGAMLVCFCLEICVILFLRVLYIFANKKKERISAELERTGQKPSEDETAFADLVRKPDPTLLHLFRKKSFSLINFATADGPAKHQLSLHLLKLGVFFPLVC
jgi:hypothetical protein